MHWNIPKTVTTVINCCNQGIIPTDKWCGKYPGKSDWKNMVRESCWMQYSAYKSSLHLQCAVFLTFTMIETSSQQVVMGLIPGTAMFPPSKKLEAAVWMKCSWENIKQIDKFLSRMPDDKGVLRLHVMCLLLAEQIFTALLSNTVSQEIGSHCEDPERERQLGTRHAWWEDMPNAVQHWLHWMASLVLWVLSLHC